MKPFLRRSVQLGLLSLSLTILSPRQVFGQQNQLNRITLNWNLYKALKHSDRPYTAFTAHTTTHKYRATQKGNHLSLKFMVGVELDRERTLIDLEKFANLDDARKKDLLNHEQGHSDLAIIYGRLLYDKLSKGVYTIKGYQKEVKKIYDTTMKELAEINFRYDMETLHGEEPGPQEKWDLYFKRELKS